MNKWDVRFMNVACREIAPWSKDPTSKVGCLVVSPDRRQFSIGFNGFPTGIDDAEEDLNDRDIKNAQTVHAELNAILNARRNLSGWTMYSTKFPCLECGKAIIQAGLIRLVTTHIDMSSRWWDSQIKSELIMNEAGIEVSIAHGEYE